jgi:hypothetical protein
MDLAFRFPRHAVFHGGALRKGRSVSRSFPAIIIFALAHGAARQIKYSLTMTAHQFSNFKQENAMQNLEQAIRERAYHLWIAAGSPEGNSDAYWLDAQRELLAGSVEPAGAAKAKTKTMTKSKAGKKSADKPKENAKENSKAPARSKRKAA